MTNVITLRQGGVLDAATGQAGYNPKFDPGVPKPQGNWEVRVWSPDQRQYHHDGIATMIPHAEEGKGGRSLGFSPEAGVVRVGANPATGEGGVPVDMGALRVSKKRSQEIYDYVNAHTTNPADRIEMAYRIMAQESQQKVATAEPPQQIAVAPSVTYTVPQPEFNGAQSMAYPPPPRVGAQSEVQAPAAPPIPVPGQSVAAPMPAAQMPVTQPVPTAPVSSGQAPQPDLLALLLQQNAQTQQMMQGMIAALHNLAQLQAPPPQSPPQPVPEPVHVPTQQEPIMGVQEPASGSEENPRNHISGSADATFSREQVHKVVQQSFETLGIPRLGPAPTKPSYFVEFDMGRLGRLTARYHWVGVHGQGLFLIYDRRYELGTEYVPPNLGKEVFTVNCPEQNKSFKVQNPGFVHPFGKLLIINLVIKDDVDQGQLEVDEVPPMQLGDGRSTEMDVQSAVTLDQMLNPH